ncbi:MAG: hypothetical protein M3315_11935, partial [Actinomycetota bacterium]|nr:hypothetical protein [Actinomycetota bacterium]
PFSDPDPAVAEALEVGGGKCVRLSPNSVAILERIRAKETVSETGAIEWALGMLADELGV